jgi:hypothetical protein
MKKIAFLSIIMLVCLVLIGLVYARWSETLDISGTVNTGEVDWEFVSCSVLDRYAPPPYYPTPTPDFNAYDGFNPPEYFEVDKNVGWGSCSLRDTDSDGDMDTIDVALKNVYPSYFNEVTARARNNGTVPIIIDRVLINGYEIRKEPTPVVRLDLNGDGKDDVEIWWANGFGTQIHPGNYSPAMTFWFHVLQDAPEGQTLSFSIKIDAVQWNEYISP